MTTPPGWVPLRLSAISECWGQTLSQDRHSQRLLDGEVMERLVA
jgi:hypothetical protein